MCTATQLPLLVSVVAFPSFSCCAGLTDTDTAALFSSVDAAVLNSSHVGDGLNQVSIQTITFLCDTATTAGMGQTCMAEAEQH